MLQNEGLDANHPKIKALKEEIELIASFLKKEQPTTNQQQPSRPSVGYDMLLLKKLELKRLENAGLDPNHPKLKSRSKRNWT